MPHANAPLTETGRLRLARCVVDEGWSRARAAERFQVSRTTAARWADRYRELGRPGWSTGPSRPHRCPRRGRPPPMVRKIVHLRSKKRLGPVAIAALVGVAPSTVHRVLARAGISRPGTLDRATGEPVRRYEIPRPRRAGPRRHQEARQHPRRRRLAQARPRRRQPQQPGRRDPPAAQPPRPPADGYGYIHIAVDDHSRLAYSEILRRRDARDRRRVLGPGPGLLRRPRHHGRTGADRQRLAATAPALAPTPSPSGHQAQADPALPAADQRQGRNGSTAPCSTNGPTRGSTPARQPAEPPCQLATPLQPPPAPHRTRRPPTHQPVHQPLRAEQLG